MAEARLLLIAQVLQTRLQTITVANGYHTDMGLKVLTERTQSQIPTEPRCTVAVVSKVRSESGSRGGSNEMDVGGVIEFEVPSSYADAMATVYRADADIERAFQDYLQMPNALPVVLEETVFLDKPDGLPVVAAQIGWRTRYRR